MLAVCTQEEKRVFRLLSMLNGEGRLVLRLCIFFLFPQLACIPFEEYLGQAHVKKRIEDALYNSKIITADQFNILYPKSGVPDLELLDITLLVFFIRQLHPFLKASNKIWTDPLDGNASLEADIARIREIRNAFSHTGELSLTEAAFEKEYNKIECILCRMSGSVGGNKITPNEMKERLAMKKNGAFETSPVLKDISTNVTDSLERINKPIQIVSSEDKTTSISSSLESETIDIQIDDRGRRRCTFSKLCIFQSCCKDLEPRTIFATDHSSQEYRCSITSIAVLPNKTVLATDTVHNVVEAFSYSGQPFEEFKCQYPNSVCAINHDTAAVSLCKESKLLILSIAFQSMSMTLKVEYNVKCSYDIVGIKYNSDFLYVLCENGEVHTINKNTGAEQAVYQTNIRMPSYFDITPDGYQIYISKGPTITCVGLPGNCIRKYIDRSGRELKGIVVRSNKIYVSVWDEDIILKLNGNLTLVKEIFIDNLQNPMALCKYKRHLYLSKYRTDLNRCMCREILSVKI